jgi:hypothetical protein
MDVRKIPTPGVVDERRREQIQDRDDLNDRGLDIQGSVSALTVGALIGGKIANVEFLPNAKPDFIRGISSGRSSVKSTCRCAPPDDGRLLALTCHAGQHRLV